uniref:Uncharacterized protein n=1 Tax=Leptobrachium leishanense TaxID=445787 RepID=A0A8C5M2J5_9ANUR
MSVSQSSTAFYTPPPGPLNRGTYQPTSPTGQSAPLLIKQHNDDVAEYKRRNGLE